MGLFTTTIEQVTGRGYHLFGDVGLKLLNTEGLTNIEDNDVTKSVFLYRMNLEDNLEGVTRIESTDSVATIVAHYANPPISSFISIDVYPDSDTGRDTTAQLMQTSKIILAYSFESGSILFLKEGAKSVRYLVSDTINGILLLAQGITTTSTTTTTTTTTTSTSTSTSTTTTTTASDFRVTSGDAIYGRIRLQTTEVPFLPTLVISEWSATQNSQPLVISSMDSGDSYIDLNISGLIGAATILVSYGGTTAESTFGTELDTFSNLSITNSIVLPGEKFWDDTVNFFRWQVRGGVLYLDETITPTGFSGVEDTDWGNIWSKSLP